MLNVILTLLFGRNRRASLGCSCLILLLIGGAVGGVVIVAAIQLKQDQDKALNQYGETVLNLCTNLSPSAAAQGGLAKQASAKLTFIDAGVKTIRDAYFSALSPDKQAKDKTEITGVVCVNENSTVFDTDKYADSSGNVKYTCTRQRRKGLIAGCCIRSSGGTSARH